jgi:transposase
MENPLIFICNRGFSFNKWIKRYSQVKMEDETYVTVDDLAKLQKQIRRIHEEIEILKEAMAIFARK